jgi:hypothetical protein
MSTVKELTEVHDFKLPPDEKRMIEELLVIVKQCKKNMCLVDWPLARSLESVEIRCMEILHRNKVTTVD